MEQMSLPRFILLKSNSNNKFLCHTKEKDSDLFLRFSWQGNQEKKEGGESKIIGLHHLKFEVQMAETAEGLVHIRSCYNNKYWARESEDSEYMAVVGNEAEEDQSKWSCTLFKPIFVAEDNTNEDGHDALLPTCKAYKINLLHISHSNKRFVRLHAISNLLTSVDGSVDSDDDDDVPNKCSGGHEDGGFTVFDMEATAILPEYATFMGPNDKYLASVEHSESFFSFQFSASDMGERGVAQRVTPTLFPQPVSIFDQASNKAWFHLLSFITCPPDSLPNGSLFVPLKIGNHVALKCMDNGCFLSSDASDSLVCTSKTITERAMFDVGEPVRSREITDVKYDLANARIYGSKSVEKFSDSRSNHTSLEQEGSFQVAYVTSESKAWSDGNTLSKGLRVSWQAGIPFLGKSGFVISCDHDKTWETGKTQTEEKTITYTQGIKIPPAKRVTLKVTAKKAFYDVPFTCKVRDLMTYGALREYTKNDGLFSGCNEFDFDLDVIEEDL